MQVTVRDLRDLILEVFTPDEEDLTRAAIEIFQDWIDKGGTIESKVELYLDLHPEVDLDRDDLEDYVYLEKDRARMKW